MIAYEVTRQLQELGEIVSSIVMLDSGDTSVKTTTEASIKSEMLQAVNYALMSTMMILT